MVDVTCGSQPGLGMSSNHSGGCFTLWLRSSFLNPVYCYSIKPNTWRLSLKKTNKPNIILQIITSHLSPALLFIYFDLLTPYYPTHRELLPGRITWHPITERHLLIH